MRHALLALMMLLTSLPAMAAGHVGSITRIQARASVNGTPATLATPIHSGDIISTTTDGRVEVTFLDDSRLTVGGGSWLTVDSYTYSSGDKPGEALLRLAKGAFRMITSAVVDANPDRFNIVTPLAAIGIRGTDFWGGFLQPDELDVIMLEGRGVVVTSKGGSRLIPAAGLGLTVFDSSQAPDPPTTWSDEKLSRAFSTITFRHP